MTEGVPNNLEAEDVIFDRYGSTHREDGTEVRTSLFDRNYFLDRLKSRHAEFFGPDVKISFYDKA